LNTFRTAVRQRFTIRNPNSYSITVIMIVKEE